MPKTIRLASNAGTPIFVDDSVVDGPGRRTVVFVQGCPIRCPGCQNQHLWNSDGGVEVDVETVAATLLDAGQPVTISGGEPLAQADAVAELLLILKLQRPDLHVIVYTGLAVEDIFEYRDCWTEAIEVLYLADVLVDGPYVSYLDHDWMQWRGSANQRAIDVKASLGPDPETGQLYLEQVVTLDWDTPAITIGQGGDVVATAGLMSDLFGYDAVETRRCGGTKEMEACGAECSIPPFSHLRP